MEIGDLLNAGAGGGIIGLIGNIANRGIGLFEHKQRMEQMRFEAEVASKKDEHEIRLLQLEMQATAEETEHTIELAGAQGEWAVKQASYTLQDGSEHSGPTAQFIRTTMRPFVTYGMFGTAALFVFLGFGGEDMASEFVASCITMSSVCVGWWFGERGAIRTGGK